MSVKKYTLRPAYEGVLVGGTILAGPNGEAMDIMEALQEGDGSIKTDNVVLQGSLENYYGHDGLVFDAAVVDQETGEETPVEKPEPAAPVQPTTAPPAPSEEGVQAGTVPAQHGEESDYATFSNEELRSTLQERGVSYSGRTSKDAMVQLLEDDDNKRQAEGASNGS